MSEDRYRFTVDVSQALAGEIERLARETGRSKAEVFRNAINLLSVAHKAQADKMTVGAWREGENGEVTVQRQFVGL